MKRSVKRAARRVLFWLRRRGHHLLFGVCLLSLISLVLWWSVFINSSIQRENRLQHELLTYRLRAVAGELERASGPPPVGPLRGQTGLEIVSAGLDPGGMALPLRARGRGLWLRPVPAWVEAAHAHYRSLRFMGMGESGLLGLLLLASCAMLYQVIRTEKRAALEKREFWGRVTHEIKTPITGLRAFLETLKTQPMSREELLPLVDLALRQVERQQRLAENILVGQKLERFGPAVTIEPLDLKAFLGQFLQAHALELSSAEVVAELDGIAGVRVLADPHALHVILDNLVDNALKYAGPAARITIRGSGGPEGVVLSFSDDGPGFEPRRAEELFDAYRRLPGEQSGSSHGTGLGLHICRLLARSCGGELEAFSEGKGATFHLSLRPADSVGGEFSGGKRLGRV